MLVTSGRVDGGHGSPSIVHALMKGNLNPEGMISPTKGCRIFNPELDAHQCAGSESQRKLLPNRR